MTRRALKHLQCFEILTNLFLLAARNGLISKSINLCLTRQRFGGTLYFVSFHFTNYQLNSKSGQTIVGGKHELWVNLTGTSKKVIYDEYTFEQH